MTHIGRSTSLKTATAPKIFNLDESWDYLIVLDACRFDIFAILYKHFFEGILEKRLSQGIDTVSWYKSTFTKYYQDIIYISGNPYINSKVSIRGCDAYKRFFKVVDVWSFGWDDKLGTVPPWALTWIALNYIKRRRANERRLIIHYLQPHAPYISTKFKCHGFPKPKVDKASALEGIGNDSHGRGFRMQLARIIASLLVRLKLASHPWLILEALGMPPVSPMDAVRRLYGIRGLREAYIENLKLVLSYTAFLCKEILDRTEDAKIVITSDHGELLGEDGLYGHGIDHPLVRIIPWFIVREVKYIPKSTIMHMRKLALKMKMRQNSRKTMVARKSSLALKV